MTLGKNLHEILNSFKMVYVQNNELNIIAYATKIRTRNLNNKFER